VIPDIVLHCLLEALDLRWVGIEGSCPLGTFEVPEKQPVLPGKLLE